MRALPLLATLLIAPAFVVSQAPKSPPAPRKQAAAQAPSTAFDKLVEQATEARKAER